MVRLRFVSLLCIEMNDHFGNDDVFFRVNGQPFQNTIKMRTGDLMQFGPRFHFDFEGQVVVELWEADWGENDDHLGTFSIQVSELESGEHAAQFNHADKGKYEFTYRVESIPA